MLIDCGANTDCKPQYLQQFGVMASAYMQSVMGVKNPRISLLNNGEEAEKGCELTKAAYKLLSAAPINFAGNCEAREVLSGEFDALVCDGFVGNVVLKSARRFQWVHSAASKRRWIIKKLAARRCLA